MNSAAQQVVPSIQSRRCCCYSSIPWHLLWQRQNLWCFIHALSQSSLPKPCRCCSSFCKSGIQKLLLPKCRILQAQGVRFLPLTDNVIPASNPEMGERIEAGWCSGLICEWKVPTAPWGCSQTHLCMWVADITSGPNGHLQLQRQDVVCQEPRCTTVGRLPGKGTCWPPQRSCPPCRHPSHSCIYTTSGIFAKVQHALSPCPSQCTLLWKDRSATLEVIVRTCNIAAKVWRLNSRPVPLSIPVWCLHSLLNTCI